jgi:hypothetical protein
MVVMFVCFTTVSSAINFIYSKQLAHITTVKSFIVQAPEQPVHKDWQVNSKEATVNVSNNPTNLFTTVIYALAQ